MMVNTRKCNKQTNNIKQHEKTERAILREEINSKTVEQSEKPQHVDNQIKSFGIELVIEPRISQYPQKSANFFPSKQSTSNSHEPYSICLN